MLMAKLGWKVMGIEPDAIAARYAQDQGLEVVVGRLEDTKLEPESFDAITLSHVIEHIPDPVHVFKVLSCALKPGGVLVSISPNPCGMLSRIFGISWRALDPPRHLVLLGPRALAELSCNFGLQPIVLTGNWNAEWVARESISLRLYGDTFRYRRRWFPKLLAIVMAFLTLIQRTQGEEVVLIARKEEDSS
jgi:2-polyprenyl-3-methyl-5-hydroxy-6-metoxy-1,4-benzoquinol methylase